MKLKAAHMKAMGFFWLTVVLSATASSLNLIEAHGQSLWDGLTHSAQANDSSNDSENEAAIDPTGQRDSSAGINAALAEQRKLVLPCGSFLISRTIELHSHSELKGAGACTVIKGASNLQRNANWDHIYGAARAARNLIANPDFVNGNSDIHVHNLTLDGSAVQGAAVLHMASFAHSSGIVIDHVRFIGRGSLPSQDGVNFVSGSHHYRVEHSYGYGLPGACVDQWDGTHDFRITDNVCDGHGVGSYGVMVNGISSGITSPYRANTTYNGVISGNSVANMMIGGIGVWGLCGGSPQACGIVRNINITGNKIHDVKRFHGILVGDGSNITITKNDIERIGADGIRISSGSTSSPTHDIVVTDNVIRDSNNVGGKSMGIEVGSGADSPANIRLDNNVIKGSMHKFAIFVHKNAANVTVQGGQMGNGTEGTVFLPNRQ